MDKVVYRKPNRSSNSSSRGGDGLKLFNSWYFQLGFVIISGVFLFNVYKSVRITSQKLDILKQAEMEVEDLRLKNLALSIEMLDMSTDDYLEKEARNRLNFGGVNEVAFVIPENSLGYARERVESILSVDDSGESVVDVVDGWSVWFDFVSSGV